MAMAEKLAQAPTAAIGEIKMLLEASAANDYAESTWIWSARHKLSQARQKIL